MRSPAIAAAAAKIAARHAFERVHIDAERAKRIRLELVGDRGNIGQLVQPLVELLRFRNLLATLLDHLHGLLDLFDMLEHGRAIEHRDTLRTGWRRGRKAPDRHSRQEKLLHSLTPFSLGAGAGEIPATRASDHCPIRQSLRGPRPLSQRAPTARPVHRSDEHTYELQSLMRLSYAVFCLKKKKKNHNRHIYTIKQYIK